MYNRWADMLGSRENRGSSFAGVSDEEFWRHMEVDEYGGFKLTGAVRPAYGRNKTIPVEGYRYHEFCYEGSGECVPAVVAAVSAGVEDGRNRLFGVFMELLGLVGEEVDVVLGSSHSQNSNEASSPAEYYREIIDRVVLESILWDYEDMLLNDGCTGIAVVNPEEYEEVQLEEHKLLIVYAVQNECLGKYKEVLDDFGVPLVPCIKFISDREHVHCSCDESRSWFEDLCLQLEAAEEDEV